MSRRIRRTPYTGRVEAAGVTGFTVVNHTLLPKAFGRPVEEDYWHLREAVQLWDVGCQRQVEITGPDAARLVQWMTPRDVSQARWGQGLYVPVTDAAAGMINDPVLLRLDADRFRLSIADSDLALYALGLALGGGLDVAVDEPDVWPLAAQGPRAGAVVAAVFGQAVLELPFFGFDRFAFGGRSHLVARSGYSRQGGFEIYLEGFELGPALWDALIEAGRPHGIRPGSPCLPERIEGGLFSLGNDFDRRNTPFELGLGRLCATDGSVACLARDAVARIAREGHRRELRGLVFGTAPAPVCAEAWPVWQGDARAGEATSVAFSPRLQANVAVAMIDRTAWEPGTRVAVEVPGAGRWPGRVSAFPID